MNFHRESLEEKEPSINLTPLMDVMFLLVIFFAVSTTFRVYPGISVTLPKAESKDVLSEERIMVAVLNEQGQIFLDGSPIAQRTLLKVLRARQAANPSLMFVVQADENARHGRVVELMDAAKMVGISKLGIATRKPDEKQPSPRTP